MQLPPRWLRATGLLLCAVWLAAPAGAVVIHPNTALGTPDPDSQPPPEDDPGWFHLGIFGTSPPGGAIYLGLNALGEAWVLTAAHLGSDLDVEFDGILYPTDGFVGFTNPDSSPADLRAWKIIGHPPLPNLEEILTTTPITGEDVRLLLHGRVEGAFTCWDALWQVASCVGAANKGYPWATLRPRRWGTNVVSLTGAALDTLKAEQLISEEIFATSFDDATGTVLETQGTGGDSGGGIFVHDGSGWALAGIALFIFGPPDPNRPSSVAALDEDLTLYADLSYYRPQILASTGVLLPEPAGLPGAGVALVAWLGRRRGLQRRSRAQQGG